MDGVDFADGPVADPLEQQAAGLEGVPLVAHLCDDVLLLGGFGHLTALIHRVGQRLLAVYMLAVLHRGDGCDRVIVVRRAHHHGVDLLVHRVKHLTKVVKLLRLGMAAEGAGA